MHIFKTTLMLKTIWFLTFCFIAAIILAMLDAFTFMPFATLLILVYVYTKKTNIKDKSKPYLMRFFIEPADANSNIAVSYREETDAESLMKEAALLKKEKKYAEAIATIQKAFSSNGGELLGLWAKMKLVTYLQLNNQFDEAWRVLNEVNVFYTSPESQCTISDKMRLHLQREKKFDYAIPLGIYSLIKEVEYRREILGKHVNDNEVNEVLRGRESLDYVKKTIDSLIKNSTKSDIREYLVLKTKSMIDSNNKYNYRDVLNMVNKKDS